MYPSVDLFDGLTAIAGDFIGDSGVFLLERYHIVVCQADRFEVVEVSGAFFADFGHDAFHIGKAGLATHTDTFSTEHL